MGKCVKVVILCGQDDGGKPKQNKIDDDNDDDETFLKGGWRLN
jgi:hypothetical protein